MTVLTSTGKDKRRGTASLTSNHVDMPFVTKFTSFTACDMRDMLRYLYELSSSTLTCPSLEPSVSNICKRFL
jgi:hypothetical protein